MLLVKQHLARLVPGWVTQGSCDGAVIGWVQVYYSGGSSVAMGTQGTTSCLLKYPSAVLRIRKGNRDSLGIIY